MQHRNRIDSVQVCASVGLDTDTDLDSDFNGASSYLGFVHDRKNFMHAHHSLAMTDAAA
jgi:hypothetical protein